MAEATHLPSSLKATALMTRPRPTVRSHFPVSGSQSFTPSETVARRPSLLNATGIVSESCPSKLRRHLRFFQSHTFTTRLVPAASSRPSVLNAMVYADPNLRVTSHGSVHTGLVVAVKSQTFSHPSAPREARCLPSRWKATLTAASVCA